MVYPTMGDTLIVKAFVITILGGMGSIFGAIIGGYILGLIEALGAMYISVDYKDAFAFAVLVLVLAVRPQGLFGKVPSLMRQGSKTGLMVAGALLVALAIPYLVTNDYLFHLIIMAVIWSILATSLNLVLGYTGLLSLAHGAFFGLGAYTSALLVTKCDWNFWATIPPAMLVAAAGGVLIGVLTLRLAGALFRHQHHVVRDRRQPGPGEVG